MLRYLTLPVTPFQQNCSIVWDEDSRQAAVIDPGGDLTGCRRRSSACSSSRSRSADPCPHRPRRRHGGTGAAARGAGDRAAPGRPVRIDMLPQQSVMFGLAPSELFTPTRWLHDGDTVELAGHRFDVRHCPGHTPGHVVFHAPRDPAGLRRRRAVRGQHRPHRPAAGRSRNADRQHPRATRPMGDDTVFIPGHGPESTFGHERRTNPFVGGT